MPAVTSIENNFTKGLVTEFTGLNFPENAATDTDNCEYTLVGDVLRRKGIDAEANGQRNTVGTNSSFNSYLWKNAGGDGSTQIVVTQTGANLFFYRSSSATTTLPLSTQLISTNSFLQFATGVTPNPAIQECQFTDGNGYLFVFHPSCDPFYVTYTNGVFALNRITVQVRDFIGTNENSIAVNLRPTSLTNDHLYNLINQGWTSGSPWLAHSVTNFVIQRGVSITLTVESGLTVTLGDIVGIYSNSTSFSPGSPTQPQGTLLAGGNVTAYSGTTMTILVTGITDALAGQSVPASYISPYNHGFINTWQTAIGNYPSNADVWWYFKDNANAFNPGTQIGNVTFNSGPSPKGHYLLNAFSQNRSAASGISGITTVATSKRPKTGTWFQGRVWYTGVDDSQTSSADTNFYTWSENVYFSQIVTDPIQFGQCYQTNDPTSEKLFSLLPTDGGVITIQGSGSIYKLFSMQNALLVFAANGVWYVTGSQGIGFTANDYTIVKLSAVKSISSTSFVDVNGLPYFWNEEGIYSVESAKQGTSLLNSPLHVNPLEVIPITVGTILQFYNNIPRNSKQYVRGAYDPIDYRIQWVYRSTNDSEDPTNRYHFDKILNYNTYNKAFYPYTVKGVGFICGIIYVSYPGGVTTPDPQFKYLTQLNITSNNFTFADEHDLSYKDWASLGSTDYTSFFVTGYKLHGQGQRRFQVPYIYVFSKNDVTNAYQIQGIWDYALNPNSGRWSNPQLVLNVANNFGLKFRRHVMRGQGLVLQLKVSSVSGQPFDILGWSTYETQNAGV